MNKLTNKLTMFGLVAVGALSLAACEDKSGYADHWRSNDVDHTNTANNNAKPVANPAGPDLAPMSPPTAKGGGPAVGSREWARDRMASIRCEHYSTCGDIATGKKYDSQDSCITQERASLDKDWKLDKCTSIDQPRFDACVSAVRAKKCDKIFDTSPSECSESKLCIEPKK